MALGILGLAAAPIFGQTQTTATSTSGDTYVQTTKLVGTKVKTAQGEDIGTVKDIVIDRNTGCLAYTVLSTGGTGTRVAGRAKTVAVPWSVYSTTTEPNILTVQVDRDRIYNAPAFEYSRISEPGWINNVYSYYGVSAETGVSGRTSGTTSAASSTTSGMSSAAAPAEGPNTSAQATATPMANQSPGLGASASPYASPNASASASQRTGRGESREESTSGRARTTSSPSSAHHRHGENAEESPSETGTTTREHGRTSRHRTGEEATEPGTSSRHRTGEEATEPGTSSRHRTGEEAEPGSSPRSTPEQER
jgi:sporulation protein YlmC with PRC-barrel domain